MIREAIEAGKHVLSEKPIAKDLETAARLIRWYEHQKREEIWSVGENFRFFEPVTFAVEQIKKLGGEVVTFSVDLHAFIDETDEFYQTSWQVYLPMLPSRLPYPQFTLSMVSPLGARSLITKEASFSMVGSTTSQPCALS